MQTHVNLDRHTHTAYKPDKHITTHTRKKQGGSSTDQNRSTLLHEAKELSFYTLLTSSVQREVSEGEEEGAFSATVFN